MEWNEIKLIIASLSALWLGILTSISPCPLATNVATITYISKSTKCPYKTFFAGSLYALGRMFTYAILGFILVGGLLSVPNVANFLQHLINKLFGPFCILIGLILLNAFKINFSFGINHNRFKKLMENSNFIGAFLLGMALGLSFGPVSAALFFGSFAPLAIENHSSLVLPAIYGLGTCLPVIGFAILLAFFMHKSEELYTRLAKFEVWFTKITGAIFIIAGLYLIVNHHI